MHANEQKTPCWRMNSPPRPRAADASRLSCRRSVLAGIAASPWIGPALAAPTCTSGDAAAAFELLTGLTGNWMVLTDQGWSFPAEFRLTAAGSVLVETWNMSPRRQSMTVYHRDGAHLIATHYCPLGNQPRLRYRPGSGNRLAFEFLDATNLPDPSQEHLHTFWTEIETAETMRRSEIYVAGAREAPMLATFARTA